MRGNDGGRGAFEFQPGEVTRPSAHERLGQGQKRDQKPGPDGVVFRLQLGVDHERKSHQKRPAEHQIRNNAQHRQRDRKGENKGREDNPFDAAQVGRDVGLRRRVDGLEESLAKDAVIDNGTIDQPGEARRAVDLAFPFGRAGRAEKDQVFEAQE